jgi:hypothetical protein
MIACDILTDYFSARFNLRQVCDFTFGTVN